jgi:hypothetical protein
MLPACLTQTAAENCAPPKHLMLNCYQTYNIDGWWMVAVNLAEQSYLVLMTAYYRKTMYHSLVVASSSTASGWISMAGW